jgi:hypothetical protein
MFGLPSVEALITLIRCKGIVPDLVENGEAVRTEVHAHAQAITLTLRWPDQTTAIERRKVRPMQPRNIALYGLTQGIQSKWTNTLEPIQVAIYSNIWLH